MTGDFILLRNVLASIVVEALGLPHLFKGHAILDQEGNPRIEISYIFFQHEVLLRLTGDLSLVFALCFLRYCEG